MRYRDLEGIDLGAARKAVCAWLDEHEQDALGETRQLETLICSVMYGERRYTIDIDERAPLLDALMTGKPYEVKTDDRPSAL
jgi:hypothetical protein